MECVSYLDDKPLSRSEKWSSTFISSLRVQQLSLEADVPVGSGHEWADIWLLTLEEMAMSWGPERRPYFHLLNPTVARPPYLVQLAHDG